jgi:signal transduction histidine kinase
VGRNYMNHQGSETGVASAREKAARMDESVHCPLTVLACDMRKLDSDLCDSLDEAGCPIATDVLKRLLFETLLSEVSSAFVNVPAREVDAQIERSLRQIVEFLGLDRCGLGEVSRDRKKILVTHSYQLPGIPTSANIMLDSEFPVYAKMVHQGLVIRLPDDLPADAIREREYISRTGLKSNLTIPLLHMGAVVGGIGFTTYRSNRILSNDLIPRLRLLGDIFTNALARKRGDEALSAKEQSLEQARKGLQQLATKLIASQEEERARIAREMHDDWTQRLAVLALDAARLENQLGANESALKDLRSIREQMVRLAEDVHALSRQLHPSILSDLGLVEALRSECAGFSRREGIQVDYRAANISVQVPKEVALCIYRIAQESLRNIARHAAVNETFVTLTASEDELILRIEDFGVGFDVANERTKPGIGLSSMKERVSLIQGQMFVTSEIGQGTTIEVRAPLKETTT